jgi:S-adenosylmethionine-diacylgycerolhomoserine-N-methlytransferase
VTAVPLTKDLLVLYRIAFAPIRGKTHQERLESFYAKQADDYDSSRRRLLHGRKELMQRLPILDGGVWIDLGGGTGANLELLGNRVRRLKKIYLVDLTPSLLQIARRRIAQNGWTNVTVLEEDAAGLPLHLETADAVTFSYSLSMMADWYVAVENAFRLLKPGGHLGVVDFYVSRKHPKPNFVRHGAWTRWFWPWWFAHDNVFLNPDHVPYLHQLFEPLYFEECRGRIKYLPVGRAPYFLFVGRKQAVRPSWPAPIRSAF